MFDKQTNKFLTRRVEDNYSTFNSKFKPINLVDAVLIPLESNSDLSAESEDFKTLGKLSRGVKKRVYPSNMAHSGTVVFNICVNRSGEVVYLKHDVEKTTITNEEALLDISEAMSKTKFVPDSSAPEKECGQWRITIKKDY